MAKTIEVVVSMLITCLNYHTMYCTEIDHLNVAITLILNGRLSNSATITKQINAIHVRIIALNMKSWEVKACDVFKAV